MDRIGEYNVLVKWNNFIARKHMILSIVFLGHTVTRLWMNASLYLYLLITNRTPSIQIIGPNL